MSNRKLALVTGSSMGIGRLFAIHLAKRGYDLVLVALGADDLEEVANEISTLSRVSVETLDVDLASRDGMDKALSYFGPSSRAGRPVDLLINNAGIAAGGDLAAVDDGRLAMMLDLNVTALTRLTRAAFASMRQAGGTIINIASGTGFVLPDNLAAYAASKAYVLALSTALQPEAERLGIRLMCVVPGLLGTQGFHNGSGVPLTEYPADLVMAPADLVATVFRALEMGEIICAPALEERALLDRFEEARRNMAGGISSRHPASRYGL